MSLCIVIGFCGKNLRGGPPNPVHAPTRYGYHGTRTCTEYAAACTHTRHILLHKGELITPSASAGALKGITRDTALEIADEIGIPWREANLTRYDVWVADELFLTGTAEEIVPIVEVDARKIGDGKPGEMTSKFLEAFRRRASLEGTKI